MAEVTTLTEAVAELVADGDAIALEGFTHLIPFAAAHELLRQNRRELELIRMTPDLLYDQMIGMGAARKLVFSYGGNPGVGGLHRFRDAIEHGWPRPIELEEHSHAGMANRYAAGAARLPFAVMRGYVGTDLAPRTRVEPITCPFTGEELVAVPALRPDVAIVHAQEADREGNVQLWGIPGVQKEAVLAADRALVTVERVVDELEPRPGGVVIPGWVIDAVVEAPGGSYPSYSLGITNRDNDFYRFWDKLSRDREQFSEWMQEHVLNGAGALPASAAKLEGER
jgi:glutaconate CoA-transferase subunit A